MVIYYHIMREVLSADNLDDIYENMDQCRYVDLSGTYLVDKRVSGMPTFDANFWPYQPRMRHQLDCYHERWLTELCHVLICRKGGHSILPNGGMHQGSVGNPMEAASMASSCESTHQASCRQYKLFFTFPNLRVERCGGTSLEKGMN